MDQHINIDDLSQSASIAGDSDLSLEDIDQDELIKLMQECNISIEDMDTSNKVDYSNKINSWFKSKPLNILTNKVLLKDFKHKIKAHRQSKQ